MAAIYVFILVLFILVSGGAALSQEQLPVQTSPPEVRKQSDSDWVRIKNPAEDSEFIGKRPEIKVEFAKPVQRDKLLVTLDGTDITQLLVVSDGGFTYSPVIPLPSGKHTLIVTASDENGVFTQKTISFKSRHAALFDEAVSKNDASLIFTQAIVKPNAIQQPAPLPPQNQTAQPPTTVSSFNRKIEGNLKSDNRIKTGDFEVTLNGNLRYFDQDAPTTPPLSKGFDVANWLLTGTYKKDALKAQASVGDVQVTETPNTINLNRKGGIFQVDYDIFQIRAFSVKNVQTYGLNGGIGIGADTDDHVLGASAGVKLLDKKVEFRGIYVTGKGGDNPAAVSTANPQPGTPPNPFGTSNQPGVKEGDVVGLLLTTDLLQNRLKTEFEADFSRFDPDNSDEFGKRSDSAYLARAYGVLGMYNYDAKYEYFGRDYGTVGNLGTLRDREGAAVSQGLVLGRHAFMLNLSSYNDNVRNDPLFARIYQHMAGINYTFTGIPNLTIGLGYQRSLQESRHEPADTPKVDSMNDNISANASYVTGKWVLGASAIYSILNDRESTNADTTSMTLTFTPAYTLPSLSLAPMLSWNRSKVHSTGVWTDSYTAGFNVFARIYGERLTLDSGSTYTMVKADDGSVDTKQTNITANLNYNLKDYLGKNINPVLTLRNTYLKTRDKVNPSADSDTYGLFLVVTMNVPFLL